MDVKPDVINILLDLARSTFGDTLHAYYEGDPIMIPKANLPCFIAEKVATSISTKGAPSGHDNLSEQLSLRIVFDKNDDTGASDSVDLTERKIRQMVEARNPSTGYFLPNTLLYALRTNLTLGNRALDEEIDISYGLQPRPQGQFTSEVSVDVVVREVVQIQNRV